MQKIIIRFFVCLLIHPSMLLMELIVRGIDGDFMTGGLHPLKDNVLGPFSKLAKWHIKLKAVMLG